MMCGLLRSCQFASYVFRLSKEIIFINMYGIYPEGLWDPPDNAFLKLSNPECRRFKPPGSSLLPEYSTPQACSHTLYTYIYTGGEIHEPW